ncbi:lipocalin family protein [Flavihumibacter petaseus]|uniref:Lipocalin-like domain-containing protein n=1 Tax=Flavihumibacter petaseus NBRC 106054 TaxID=1220578 RepID=A0A0E9N467_9BACT|nr:lipocalin family protein [Flavihumibacter petaseus]GAO44160.1 hypothetical protein FPE01S_03_01980 [Flavihumibacter petaseus NBRC 106054]
MNRYRTACAATLILGIGLFAASCHKKKVEDLISGNDEISSQLVNKKWNLTEQTIAPAIDVNGDGTPDTNMLNFLPECAKDDYIVFDKEGSFTIFDGTNLCTESQPEVGSWLLTNEKDLLITQPAGIREAKVISITGTSMKLEVKDFLEGQNVTITEVYTKR